MAIKMRRGLIADLDRSKLVAGEIVMSTDTGFVGIAKAPNDVMELAKKDDIPDEVIANPSGTATDDLTKIQIGNTVYGIEGGSGEVVEMTFAEYQALTPQQKMDGTVRYVTNYPSGGGSSYNFSTTEVNTGQKWIDGKDIYCVVISNQHVQHAANVYWEYDLTSLDIDEPLWYFARCGKNSNTPQIVFPWVTDYHDNNQGVKFEQTKFGIRGKVSGDYTNVNIILWYTKN